MLKRKVAFSPMGPSRINPKPVAEKFASPAKRSSLPSRREMFVYDDTRLP